LNLIFPAPAPPVADPPLASCFGFMSCTLTLGFFDLAVILVFMVLFLSVVVYPAWLESCVPSHASGFSLLLTDSD
jgi:hypothetical protein